MLNSNKSYTSGDLEDKVVGGWCVVRRLDAPDRQKGETGGICSCCYIVEKDGVIAFMKVPDYSKAIPQDNTFEKRSAEFFNFEKAISELCTSRNIRNIVRCIDSGEYPLEGYSTGGRVPYIVFEMADGDARKVIEKENSSAFKLKSLHDIAVGIRELHDNGISHQDIKPSNILFFKNESKIGDLGSSLFFGRDISCPFPLRFNGDKSYAAPEHFFQGFRASKENIYQIDNYMLGGLVVFYFTGVNFNHVLNYYLPDELRFLNTRQSKAYSDIMPDMMNAFKNALRYFEIKIPIDEVKEGLVSIVSYLCNPDPSRRGHPKNVSFFSRTPKYDLQRTILELEELQTKAECAMMKI